MANDNHDERGRFASAPAGLKIASMHDSKKSAHLAGMALRRSGIQAFVMKGEDAEKFQGFKGVKGKYVVYHSDASAAKGEPAIKETAGEGKQRLVKISHPNGKTALLKLNGDFDHETLKTAVMRASRQGKISSASVQLHLDVMSMRAK